MSDTDRLRAKELYFANTEIERLTVLLNEKRDAVTHWKSQLNEARVEIERLKADNAHERERYLRAEIDKLRAEIEQLRAEKAAMIRVGARSAKYESELQAEIERLRADKFKVMGSP